MASLYQERWQPQLHLGRWQVHRRIPQGNRRHEPSQRTTDFTDRDGDDTDHSSINAEFDAVALTTEQIRENLALIQRDDGALKNGIVTADALDDSAFDAVLINVNEAVQDAQQSATSALTSATTALSARDAAITAKTASETARDVTILNANNASASALAALNSQNAAATSQSDAAASKAAAASSQTAAAASATSAATSATTATTQAGIATTKAADAAASATASASSAAGSQTAKTASENARDGAQTARAGAEAARDTAVAAKDAAQVSQSAASSSASSAGTSATTATTKAAEAVTSANSAATSATTATTQATTATTKATEAAASAASALASKNAAATSEANAAASQVSAANSAAAAATALDNFDDRYLGPKASDPTLDNDGNALTDGALYSNTTTKKMRIYFDAYGWIDASSASVATLVTFEFVATTANQTTFSGNDANGVLLSYTVGSEIVIGNGAKLKRGVDYTASNGSSIVLAEGVGIGQEISVLAFGSFLVANTYMKSESDALLALKAPLANPSFTGLVTTAGQIKFPATQNASADANTLDDYEEGTWTPSFATDGAQPSITYAVQSGQYVKIGRQVFCEGYILVSSIASQGTGSLQLAGLPFTSGREEPMFNFSDGGAIKAYWNANSTQIYGYAGRRALCRRFQRLHLLRSAIRQRRG